MDKEARELQIKLANESKELQIKLAKEARELRLKTLQLQVSIQIKLAGIFGFVALGVALFALGWQISNTQVPETSIITADYAPIYAFLSWIIGLLAVIVSNYLIFRVKQEFDKLKELK